MTEVKKLSLNKSNRSNNSAEKSSKPKAKYIAVGQVDGHPVYKKIEAHAKRKFTDKKANDKPHLARNDDKKKNRQRSNQASLLKAGHNFDHPSVAKGSESRAAAALCINAVEEGKSLSEALPFYTQTLDDRDRALVMEIVYGTLRFRRLLANTANKLLKHNISKDFNTARTLILCGLYQLKFTRMPARAVVAATVGACPLCHCKNFTSLVNAVLRRFLREGGELADAEGKLAVEYSFPDWMVETFQKDYGEEKTREILQNSNQHAPMFIRVENSKISTSEYLKLLEKAEIKAKETTEISSSIVLEHPVNVESLPSFNEGLVAVQDLAASLAAPLLDLKDGQRVLDCCCAPGGKSAHILDLADNLDLTCADIDEKRLEQAKENLLRLGRKPNFVLADISADTSELSGQFDRILVDAPCSGSGVIRRHPDIKWLRRKKDIPTLTATQEKILDNTFELLKQGGILVYTTCSIFKDENEKQVDAFLKRHPNAKLEKITMHGNEVDFYQRLPGDNDSDGFFYAKFTKI